MWEASSYWRDGADEDVVMAVGVGGEEEEGRLTESEGTVGVVTETHRGLNNRLYLLLQRDTATGITPDTLPDPLLLLPLPRHAPGLALTPQPDPRRTPPPVKEDESNLHSSRSQVQVLASGDVVIENLAFPGVSKVSRSHPRCFKSLREVNGVGRGAFTPVLCCCEMA
ncbi:hypothetical protein O3P69_009933 [Scylla paramamosain]|uniref:Uncharacterized protein n=1 Tax=Scylla paramamosain TaxID=85552 RepID=A0AAW0SR72_SCYPA